jgi:hypothetical protein
MLTTGFNAHDQIAIMDHFTGEVVGMAGNFEMAYKAAHQWLAMRKPYLLPILCKERDGLKGRGKDNAGRFYTTAAERGVYLALYTMMEDYTGFYEDNNGIVRAKP